MKKQTKKKLVLLWWRKDDPRKAFPEYLLKKDPGLFPLYFLREYKVPYEIVALNTHGSETLEDLPEGGKLIAVANKYGFTRVPTLKEVGQRWLYILPFVKYIIKNRNSISHLMLFHSRDATWHLMFLCHIFCPHAKIYLKLDSSANGTNLYLGEEAKHPKSLKKRLYHKTFLHCMTLPHLISAETTDAFEALKADPFFARRNIAYVPDGLERREIGSGVKQKRFLTVGRLGTEQKNTELLLRACANVDLADWQFWFVGGIEKEEQDFQAVIDHVFTEHPQKRQQMIFTSNISEPARLWQLYEESAVFVFPSRYESFGISPLEACYAGCYLILSEVGCAGDLAGACGGEGVRILEHSKQDQQDEDAMQKQIEDAMQAIIKGEVSTSFDRQKRRDAFESHFLMENIVKCDAFKAFFADKRAQ